VVNQCVPQFIKGESFKDNRGQIFFNNDFDLKYVRRFYEIENINSEHIRGWKGHTIQSRWFFATKGVIKISVSKFDKNEKLYKDSLEIFELDSNTKDVLYVPKYHATTIKQLTNGAKVMVMSDYLLNEKSDEIMWDIESI
jgi:dTDP-4-dehydrorhamnose 3,5-epimerase-like enzyme